MARTGSKEELLKSLNELLDRLHGAQDAVDVWSASEDRPELQALRGDTPHSWS
jgi:hypothetical protein